MENNILFGNLRTSLGYKTPSSMNRTWTAVFPGESMPDDHIYLPLEKAKQFVTVLLEPKKGRSTEITNAARHILSNIELSQNGKTVAAMPPTSVEPEPDVKQANKTGTKMSATAQFFSEFFAAFHPADLVFYGVVGIGCFGVSGTLPGVGIVIAILWFAVAALALHRCKVFARVGDFVFLVFIEVVVGSISHVAWANKALWDNVTSLPITVYINRFIDGANQVVLLWQGETEIPFYVACYVAFVLVSFGGYAVAVSVLANRKRLKSIQTDTEKTTDEI